MNRPKKIWHKIVIGLVFILVLFASFDLAQNLFGKKVKNVKSPYDSVQTSKVTISLGDKPFIPFTITDGFTIHVFAKNLGNPRTLFMTPEGTLLVSNPTNGTVTALPDKDNDGVADENKTVITGENHVHGIAMYNGELFIANVDSVVKYGWDEGRIIATRGPVLFTLPPNNNHNNRSIVFDMDGRMYLSLGSTCNVCNDAPQKGGSVLFSDASGTGPYVFAKGLRNAAFLAINPITDELWGTEMGRDNLGDDIPPDEINIIRKDADYGWPKCYGDNVHDTNFDKSKSDPCTNTVPPVFRLPAHSAPLGLTFVNSPQFPKDWQGDLLVALHGSWNRSTVSGYKIVHLKVDGNTILGAEDFLTGFNLGFFKDDSLGRPVSMVFDSKGNLYLSDDKSGNVYIIQREQ